MGIGFWGLSQLGAFFLLLAAVAPGWGADFSGRVVAVVSGDVVEVLREGHRERVHLSEISCPGRRKPHWEAARQFVAREALGKVVTVLDRGKARGVRRGEVTLPGNRSLSQELVRNGWARWDRAPSGDSYLGVLEEDARAARRGLWADADPVQPGETLYRRGRRKR